MIFPFGSYSTYIECTVKTVPHQYLIIFCNLVKLTFLTKNTLLINKKSLQNWRIFDKREFDDELGNIRWENIIKPESKTDVSCSLFLTKTTKLLDEIGSYRKFTRNKIERQQKSWITQGILKPMKIIDSI